MPVPDYITTHPRSGETPCEPQAARAMLMIRPACFGFNPQTARSNVFQHPAAPGVDEQAQRRALAEFDGVAAALSRVGVEVIIAADTAQPAKPDAVFPNNWVSFHRDGSVVLYPMLAPNRRHERRQDVLDHIVQAGSFQVSRTIDLTWQEANGKFLEGTGSLVLDRTARVAYACLSARTDLDLLGQFAQQLDYDIAAFEARDQAAQPIYHTNVMLAIGTRFAVVCSEAIAVSHRDAVLGQLRATGHEVIAISQRQMHAFAGNILQVTTADGQAIALSTGAWRSFDPTQQRVLESHADIMPVEIPTIEHLGGGGVRCMLAEVHLPKRQ